MPPFLLASLLPLLLGAAGVMGAQRRVAVPAAQVSWHADTIREHRGLYETGFEISWFHPCGAPAGDDLWWVTLSDAALRQRDSLTKALTGTPRALYVRWRGTTSPKMPLGAGHMGRGSRYLLVTEILELRPSDESGCSAA